MKQSKCGSLVVRPGDALRITFDPEKREAIHQLIADYEHILKLDGEYRDCLLAFIGSREYPESFSWVTVCRIDPTTPCICGLADVLASATVSVHKITKAAFERFYFCWLSW